MFVIIFEPHFPPLRSPARMSADDLQRLRLLLEHLPKTLPEATPSSLYSFTGFEPDSADVENYGSVAAAINRTLEVRFGFKSRSEGDGIIRIPERGPPVCAVVDVLKRLDVEARKERRERQPQSSDDRPDAIFEKWVHDLTKAAEITCKEAGEVVSDSWHMN